MTAFPVRYADGVVKLQDNDLESAGFGTIWGRTRSWSNGSGYTSQLSPNGSGMVIAEEPHLVPFMNGMSMSMAVVLTGTDALFFDQNGGNWQARHYGKETLTQDFMSGDYILTDTLGDQIR